MNNEQLNQYNQLQSEIMNKVMDIQSFETLQEYKTGYVKFFTTIQELQQKYEQFNREVIRKYHLFNPIKPGKCKYFEELVGEAWYFLIHIPSYESIIRECLCNGKSLCAFMNVEREIVDLFNQDLYLDNFYIYCEKFFIQHQGYSMLDFEQMIQDKQDAEICRLFFTHAIEYLKFDHYVMTCLDNNSLKLEKLFQILPFYKPLLERYHQLCKDFIRTQYSSIQSIRDIYAMYMQLLEYSSTLDSNVIKNEMKHKLSNLDYELAVCIMEDRKYNVLVPFCGNEEQICNELLFMIKKESIIKSFMSYSNLPKACETKYQKLMSDFGQESYIYNDLFVFNDTFHYKVLHPRLVIPPLILSMQRIHEENYKKIYPSRKLKWIYENSFVTLAFGQAILKVDFLSFLVLYCFNEDCKLSMVKLCRLTNIPFENIQAILYILVSKQIIKKYNDFYTISPQISINHQVICIDSLVRQKPTKIKTLCTHDERIKASIMRELKMNKKVLSQDLVEKYLPKDVQPIIDSLENLGFVQREGVYIVYD